MPEAAAVIDRDDLFCRESILVACSVVAAVALEQHRQQSKTGDFVRNVRSRPEEDRRMLHIHRAERTDGLVDALAGVISAPLADPLQPEVVAVPTRGVERWLTQRLSVVLGASPGRGDGVCANVEFPFPGRLVNGAVATASGVDAETDPWLPARAVWPLLEVVERSLGEPWLAPLAAHLGAQEGEAGQQRRTRRFAAVRHVADLFERYAVHRPGLLLAWAEGAPGGWQ